MKATTAEVNFFWSMFRYSAYESLKLSSTPSIFEKTIHEVALHRDPKPVYEKVYNKEGKRTALYLIGLQDGATFTTNKELLIDRMEDIREWIHTEEVPDKNGWKRLSIWPSNSIKDILSPYKRQLFDYCLGSIQMPEHRRQLPERGLAKKVFQQLLKGLISEL
jgi:hypothetical protein